MGILENIEPLAYEIAFWSQALENVDYPNDQLGGVALEVSERFRTLAILLLLTGDATAFCFNLSRSGQARAAYLRRMQQSGIVDDHHQGAGRYPPLVDAISAGDFETALTIADLSPREFLQGHEYEDDYCFGQMLHILVSRTEDTESFISITDRFEKYLGDDADARLGLCIALYNQDQKQFDESFDEFLNERSERIESDKARGQIESSTVVAIRTVYVDGLAVLRLADRANIRTQAEYLYCPSFARQLPSGAFPRE